jgi:hypothetical protein
MRIFGGEELEVIDEKLLVIGRGVLLITQIE